VTKLLGRGGMAEVFLGHDERLDRAVAIKRLAADADSDTRARFVREGQALARLQHRHIVQVLAAGDDDAAQPYMVLQYVEGGSLTDLIGAQGIDEETACALLAQAAHGIAAAHAVGVIHRDIKPDNLLVDEDANVRVTDFGAAVVPIVGNDGFVTREGVAVGTPHFMSPEQARGQTADARTDLWGLGATLYAALTGVPPFYVAAGEPEMDILARVVRDDAPDVRQRAPAVSEATARLVSLLMKREREQRPSDAAHVAQQLEHLADAAGGTADVTASAVHVAEQAAVQRPHHIDNRTMWLVGGCLVALVGALLVSTQLPRKRNIEHVATMDGGVDGGATVEGRSDAGAQMSDAGVVDAGVVVSPGNDLLPVEGPPSVLARFAAKPTAALARQLLHGDEDNHRELLSVPTEAMRVWLQVAIRERAAPDLLEQAALRSPAHVSAIVVEQLRAAKSDVSIDLLGAIAAKHADEAVRNKARAARDTLFRVDDTP
jgi:hypothetical protein